MAKANILTICIHYHNTEEVIGFIKGLFAQHVNVAHEVVVVDNSGELTCKDEDLQELCRDNSPLIYNPGKNMGYYGAASWGMNKYLEENPLPDWVIVCNTDISFKDAHFFDKLLSYHQASPSAVISPIVFAESSGRVWNAHTVVRPSCLRVHLYKLILSCYPTLFLYNILSLLKGKMQDFLQWLLTLAGFTNTLSNEPAVIYAPNGAYTIFNRSYFEAGGNLDHGSFLYGEEVFVAETVRRLGLNVLYDPRLKIIHRGRSTTNIFKSPQILRFKREAVTYYVNKFFS